MDALRDELLGKLDNKIAFTIPVFGGIPVPESVVVTWGIMLFLVLLSIICTRRLKKVPGKAQLVAEMFVGFINKFTKNTLGEHWKPFAAYFGTIGLYIGCANLIGMFGITPPTKDLNVTAALAIMSAALIYGASFRYHGFKGGLHKFVEPMPLLAPTFLFVSTIAFTNCFKLVDHVVIMTEGAPNNASTLLLYYIYQQGFTNFNYGVSSALTVIMLGLLLVVSLPRFISQDKKIHYN